MLIRTILFLEMISFHDCSVISTCHKYKQLIAQVALKCRMYNTNGVSIAQNGLIMLPTSEDMTSLFSSFIYKDISELVKLMINFKNAVSKQGNRDLLTIAESDFLADAGVDCPSEMYNQLLPIKNLDRYIALVPFSSFSKGCKDLWLPLLQLLLISSSFNLSRLDGTSVPKVGLLGLLDGACQDINLMWAIALCDLPDGSWGSAELRRILRTELKESFAYLSQNQPNLPERLDRLVNVFSVIAQKDVNGYRTTFVSYLLKDANIWLSACNNFHNLFDKERGDSEKVLSSALRDNDWRRTKELLELNICKIDDCVRKALKIF